jgi:SAM-dependent methyltransferase
VEGAYNESFFGGYRGRFNQYWFARRFYASLVKRYRKSGKVLEIGCGLGDVLARLEDRFETYGIDVSQYAIDEARSHTPKSKLRVARAEQIGELPGPFDVIAAFHVVEHLEDPFAILQLCARNTTPGGLLIIATPNTEAPFAKKKGARWFANTDPTHISLKSADEWLELIKRAGYRIKRSFSDGMWDVPYIPLMPPKMQLLMFGWPAMLQTVTTIPIIPVASGESLICVAERQAG